MAAEQETAAKPTPHVTVFVDGSAKPNPGRAGWGALLIAGGAEKELTGGTDHASNNYAELSAAILALSALRQHCHVNLYSDSEYLVNTMRLGWRRNANLDLWEQLDALCEQHEVNWVWVRGHDGHPGNERAHRLAERARENVR